MSKGFFNPRMSNNFLDTCAFDPDESEVSFSEAILDLYHQEKITLILSHTNQKEIEHPKTPAEVKRKAASMIFTLPVSLTPPERQLQSRIYVLLTGNALPAAHYADATHIFQAIKYGGCFVTTDKRILSKKTELERLGAIILKPSEWMDCYSS